MVLPLGFSPCRQPPLDRLTLIGSWDAGEPSGLPIVCLCDIEMQSRAFIALSGVSAPDNCFLMHEFSSYGISGFLQGRATPPYKAINMAFVGWRVAAVERAAGYSVCPVFEVVRYGACHVSHRRLGRFTFVRSKEHKQAMRQGIGAARYSQTATRRGAGMA